MRVVAMARKTLLKGKIITSHIYIHTKQKIYIVYEQNKLS
jgi:hypothetical protein